MPFYALCRVLGAQTLPFGLNSFADNPQLLLSPAEALRLQHLWQVLQTLLLTAPAGILVLIPFAFYNAKKHFRRDRGTTLLLASDGKLQGIATEYYTNGLIKAVIPYRDGKIHGVLERYDETGRLLKKTLYRAGRPADR